MNNPSLDIADAIRRARQFHQAGQLQRAEQLYKEVLQADPGNADANHLLGVLVYQAGKYDIAAQLISKAILKDGNKAPYYNHLGLVLQAQGKFDQASLLYKQAAAIDPGDADAYQNLGVLLQNRGSLDEALACYDQTIKIKPDYAAAHNNRGVILQTLGRPAEALAAYGKAVDIAPGLADAHNNRGNAFTSLGRIDEALAAFQRAVEINPDYAGAYNNLGHTLWTVERYDEAVAALRKAIAINPGYVDAHNNLGNTLQSLGKPDEALAAYDQALAIDPDYAGALYNRGEILYTQGRFDEALESYDRAIAAKPDYADAHNNRGNVLKALGRFEEALAAYEQAITIDPALANTHNNRGVVLHNLGRLGEALAALQQAITLDADLPDAYNNLGNTLEAQGKIKEALEAYRRALTIKPDFARAGSNLLLCMNYDASTGTKTLFAAHREWNDKYAAALAREVPGFDNTPDPGRRLRMGYVSADYHRHPVASFIEPLLDAHDRRAFEIICYSNAATRDEVTERLQTLADDWRSIAGMPDERVAEIIREDGIDILVDLSGHTAGNRMGVFARKPAPVQVTYLGYPGTSGLSVMDYRISDEWNDPPGLTEAFHTEEIVRLPDGCLCFRPPASGPKATGTSDITPGQVTFASFNNTAKVTPEVIALWSAVLKAVPDSRMLLKSKSLGDKETARRLMELFKQNGIAVERLEFIGWTASSRDHLALYNRVHIGLDTFPYSGCTTTCEALWMGVPVITLAGDESRSRMSTGVLNQVGLGDLVAESTEAYIATAKALANDVERLQGLRCDLRRNLAKSSLLNAEVITRSLESAYRGMWQRWCGNRPAR